MDLLVESINAEFETLIRMAPRFGVATIVLIVGVLVGKGAQRSMSAILRRVNPNPAYVRLFEGIAFWICVVLALGACLDLLGWDNALSGFLAGGGIAAIIIGFAFREIGENLLSGLMLALNRPFEIGDVVRSGEFEGEVKELSLRATRIRAIDGSDIFIPNAQIVTQPLVNFTLDGLRRLTFTVGIDYGNDPATALRLLREATAGVAGILTDPPPLATVSALAPNYVELEVGFWVDSGKLGGAVLPVRTEAIQVARTVLRDSGFTFSSDVSTNIVIMQNPDADRPGN